MECTDLYRDIVRRHGRVPHGVGDLERASARAESYNAHCGDRIVVSVRLDRFRRIELLRHSTAGCMLCTASASLMAGHVVGLDAGQVGALHGRVRRLSLGESPGCVSDELAALAGVAAFPARRRCVMLPWETLDTAFAESDAASRP